MKKRFVILPLLLCLCFTCGLVGCTDKSNTRTLTDAEKSIVGEWRNASGHSLVTFSSDGTYKLGFSSGEFKQDSEGSDDVGHFIKFVLENDRELFYLYDDYPDLLVVGQGGNGEGEPRPLDDTANYHRVTD